MSENDKIHCWCQRTLRLSSIMSDESLSLMKRSKAGDLWIEMIGRCHNLMLIKIRQYDLNNIEYLKKTGWITINELTVSYKIPKWIARFLLECAVIFWTMKRQRVGSEIYYK